MVVAFNVHSSFTASHGTPLQVTDTDTQALLAFPAPRVNWTVAQASSRWLAVAAAASRRHLSGGPSNNRPGSHPSSTAQKRGTKIHSALAPHSVPSLLSLEWSGVVCLDSRAVGCARAYCTGHGHTTTRRASAKRIRVTSVQRSTTRPPHHHLPPSSSSSSSLAASLASQPARHGLARRLPDPLAPAGAEPLRVGAAAAPPGSLHAHHPLRAAAAGLRPGLSHHEGRRGRLRHREPHRLRHRLPPQRAGRHRGARPPRRRRQVILRHQRGRHGAARPVSGLLRLLLQLQLRHFRGARAPRRGGGGRAAAAQIRRAGRRGSGRARVYGPLHRRGAARARGALRPRVRARAGARRLPRRAPRGRRQDSAPGQAPFRHPRADRRVGRHPSTGAAAAEHGPRGTGERRHRAAQPLARGAEPVGHHGGGGHQAARVRAAHGHRGGQAERRVRAAQPLGHRGEPRHHRGLRRHPAARRAALRGLHAREEGRAHHALPPLLRATEQGARGERGRRRAAREPHRRARKWDVREGDGGPGEPCGHCGGSRRGCGGWRHPCVGRGDRGRAHPGEGVRRGGAATDVLRLPPQPRASCTRGRHPAACGSVTNRLCPCQAQG